MTEMETLETLDFLAETSNPQGVEQATDQQEAPRRRGRPPGSKNRVQDAGTASTPNAGARRGRRPTNPLAILKAEQEDFEKAISASLSILGTASSMIVPVTGTTIVMRADQGASALVEAAKVNPKLAAFLIAMKQGGAYGPLIMWSGTVLVAAMLDFGLMKPEHPPAQFLLGKDVLPRFVVAESPNGHAPGSPVSAAETAHA